MSGEVVFLLGIGVLLLSLFVRQNESNRHQRIWNAWNITGYRMTLSYNHSSLILDGEILGESTTMTVIDGEIYDIVVSQMEHSNIDEFYRFTVEGLFEQVIYYSRVQYDTVYGLPIRLGNKYHWVIEVISFEVLS